MTKVKLNSIINADEKQIKFAADAIKILEDVINDKNFISKIRETKFSRSRYVDNNGNINDIDNETIVDIIMEGKEQNTQIDNQIQLEIELKKLGRKTLGRVIPPYPLITTNILYFDFWIEKKDPLSLAAHWMHEWLHVAGFRHLTKKPDVNDVNYTIGKLVVAIGKTHSLKLDTKNIGNSYIELESYNCM